MKITFIKPAIGRRENEQYIDEGRMEPLQLAVLAGLTPPDIECVMYDDRMEQIPFDEPTDLAAITVEIYTARRSYEIAQEYRKRGVPVILGGMHATLQPEEAAKYADSILLGDAETVWADTIKDLRAGKLKPRYQGPPGVAQLGNVLPQRDIYEGKGYLPITLMQYSRGCRFACDFCAISSYFDKKHYVRPIDEVLREVERNENKIVFFVDDNLLSNHEAAKEFLRALIPMKIKWISQASLDMTNDLELMDLLARSGCIGNVIGFESINPEAIKRMKKAPNLLGQNNGQKRLYGWDRYQQQVEILRDHHLQTWAAFTLGHDGDTRESIKETLDFAMSNKFCFAAFNILMPYPGTPLYDRLKAEGRLLYDGQWWLHPEYRFNHAAFMPQNMSPEELTQACWECRHEWNRPMSVFKRSLDFKTHMSSLYRFLAYWTYNPIYSKENFKKQSMFFGKTDKEIRQEKTKPGQYPTADKEQLIWKMPMC